MIRADRNSVLVPESLTRPGTPRSKRPNKTEEEAIVEAYEVYLDTVPRPKKFDFDFQAYREDDVKKSLSQLFHNKCAYCESHYASTQPMDVEHFRPKGGVEVVEDGKAKLAEGYPWLAARWENLLPSCIDCNRPRIQHDALTDVDEKMGKANQFPITGPRMTPPKANSPSPVQDLALIIDPTIEDPATHLRFHADGTVRAITEKGRQSIRVYALNRAELALERLGLAQMIEQRLRTIQVLTDVVTDQTLSKPVELDLRDLIAHEIDALLELTDPAKPYSAMARQLIDENSPLDLVVPPPPLVLPVAVTAMLQRLDVHQPSPHHLTVATKLATLGFSPNVPPVAEYLRWTITGTVRSITLYQDVTGLVSDSKPQHEFAEDLAGADSRSDRKVTFTFARSDVDTVIVAATRFRDWADGRGTAQPAPGPD